VTGIISDPLGPLWYRGLITRDAKLNPDGAAANVQSRPSIEQELAAILSATGTKRIVVGHTPSLSGVIISQGGRLIRADSGISSYYGGPLTWVEIIGDKVTPHSISRPGQQRGTQ